MPHEPFLVLRLVCLSNFPIEPFNRKAMRCYNLSLAHNIAIATSIDVATAVTITIPIVTVIATVVATAIATAIATSTDGATGMDTLLRIRLLVLASLSGQ